MIINIIVHTIPVALLISSGRYQGGQSLSSSPHQSSMKKMWSMFSGMGSETSESKSLYTCVCMCVYVCVCYVYVCAPDYFYNLLTC